MFRLAKLCIAIFCLAWTARCCAQVTQKVVDIPTRQGVMERVVVLAPENPKAAVILFAGGHGGLQISSKGAFGWGSGNFLVRSRQMFADQGLLTVVIDAPSDRQSPPYMAGGFRTSSQHVADIKGVIAWVRKQQPELPVWLVGTSHGTQSVAYAATQLSGTDGPDGIVLTSTVLNDNRETPVPAMSLGKVRVPVLVVHHVQDGCSKCPYSDATAMMGRFIAAAKKQLLPVKGGESRGDPCEAWSHHGFNGNEREVVGEVVGWIVGK
jgi:alpha/beta superfamily hydrolase